MIHVPQTMFVITKAKIVHEVLEYNARFDFYQVKTEKEFPSNIFNRDPKFDIIPGEEIIVLVMQKDSRPRCRFCKRRLSLHNKAAEDACLQEMKEQYLKDIF